MKVTNVCTFQNELFPAKPRVGLRSVTTFLFLLVSHSIALEVMSFIPFSFMLWTGSTVVPVYVCKNYRTILYAVVWERRERGLYLLRRDVISGTICGVIFRSSACWEVMDPNCVRTLTPSKWLWCRNCGSLDGAINYGLKESGVNNNCTLKVWTGS